MDKKKIIYFVCLIITGIVLISLTVSYAFFSGKITGDESGSTLALEGGTLEIVVNGGSNITADDFMPNNTEPWIVKEITLTGKNSTNMDMPYYIKIVEDVNEFTTTKMKYKLEAINVDGNGKVSASVVNLKDINSGEIIGEGLYTNTNSCSGGCVHKYRISVYFIDTNTDQSEDMGAIYSARVEVSGYKNLGEQKVLRTHILSLGYDNLDPSVYTTPGTAVSVGDEGLRSTPDDYGTSYYYRGTVENNYLEFANKCWRIVRIAGDGSIKLVLYNDNPNNVANPCFEEGEDLAFARYDGDNYMTLFNPVERYNAYVGFMYGDLNGTTYNAVHANNTDSTILTNLKKWYDLSFNNNQKNMLADVIWCNDKSLTNNSAYSSAWTPTKMVSYGTFDRKVSAPSLICPDAGGADSKISKFTASDTINGNGKLKGINGIGDNEYKIGLMTAEEIVFSGEADVSVIGTSVYYCFSFYLLKNAGREWFTMSPAMLDDDFTNYYPRIYILNPIYSSGCRSTLEYVYGQTNLLGLRPSVALNSSVNVVGEGTDSNPYIVIE